MVKNGIHGSGRLIRGFFCEEIWPRNYCSYGMEKRVNNMPVGIWEARMFL